MIIFYSSVAFETSVTSVLMNTFFGGNYIHTVELEIPLSFKSSTAEAPTCPCSHAYQLLIVQSH